MKYKEVGNYCIQLSYGDCLKRWFLNVCKKGQEHNLKEHIINESFKTEKEGLIRFNEIVEELK